MNISSNIAAQSSVAGAVWAFYNSQFLLFSLNIISLIDVYLYKDTSN